ncbi:MAG: nucleotidyltransferase [Rhodospirillaceae bacterium]
MPIPEDQLDTWSHIGAGPGSRDTYATIQRVLESADAPYANRTFEVFLQGSYKNDTNIYGESDVDVVINLTSCFHHNADKLAPEAFALFQSNNSDANYTDRDFKRDVMAHLTAQFGSDVVPGTKAVTIKARGNRRKADVIISCNYHRYHEYSTGKVRYDTGIAFYPQSGPKIINYPKQHSDNCTTKHQETKEWFKPMVRIFKNARSRLEDEGVIEPGLAPSYYIEGLLYNVPKEHFGTSYQHTFVACLNWLVNADRTKLVTANRQYVLLWKNSQVAWDPDKCTAFIDALVRQWNEW